jgi:hypothetical protein
MLFEVFACRMKENPKAPTASKTLLLSTAVYRVSDAGEVHLCIQVVQRPGGTVEDQNFEIVFPALISSIWRLHIIFRKVQALQRGHSTN